MRSASVVDRSAESKTFPRWFVAATALVAVAALLAHDRTLGFDGLYGLFGNAVDSDVYRAGGRTVLGSDSLYSFSLFDTLPFTYPPFAALAFVPLALLSVSATTLLVHVGNLVLLYAAVFLSWKLLGYAPNTRLKLVSVFLAAAFTWFEPVRMTLWLGQINLVLLILVLWDLGRPENSRLRGIGVGIAAGLKLTPGFFVFYLLVNRQWRAAAIAAATGALTVIAGFAFLFTDAWHYWTAAVFEPARIGLLFSPANQSVNGILARILHTDAVPPILWLIVAGTTALAGLWASHRALQRGHALLSLTLCGLTAPMVSPFSWGHHWVWVVPLMVIVLDRALISQSAVWWTLPVVLAAPTMAWFHVYPDGVTAIGTFMQPVADPVVRAILENSYPILFAVVVSATFYAARPVRNRKRIDATADEPTASPTGTPRKAVSPVFDRDAA